MAIEVPRSARPALVSAGEPLESALETIASAVRYHDWLSDALARFLHPPVLEIGSGLGTLARAMCRHAAPILVSEPDHELGERLRHRLADEPRCVVTQPILLPVAPHELDGKLRPTTVVLSNVLEHIDDDLEALRSVRQELESVEYLVLVVPAHAWAYSPVDHELGHFRRYDKQAIARLVSDAGWVPLSVRYFNPLGALAWALSGRVFKRRQISQWQTDVVEASLPVLRSADRVLGGRWIGQSVIAVGRTPDH